MTTPVHRVRARRIVLRARPYREQRRSRIAALRPRARRRADGAAARDVAGELADLAAAALEAALAVARAECGRMPTAPALAVIAMGKCGGRELNYISDVDVIFVAEPAEECRTRRPPCDGDRTWRRG